MLSVKRVDPNRWRKTLSIAAQATIVYALLALLIVIMLGPYLYIFASSFKETYSLISIPPQLFPEQIVWDNYLYILSDLPFATWFLNSSFVAIVVTVGTVLITTTCYPI
jgi:ABC-type glycerol-3-phosphate transport system permease component